MFKVEKFGQGKYNIWCTGTLNLSGLEITDIFFTNFTTLPEVGKEYKVKKVKISKDKNNVVRFYLEF